MPRGRRGARVGRKRSASVASLDGHADARGPGSAAVLGEGGSQSSAAHVRGSRSGAGNLVWSRPVDQQQVPTEASHVSANSSPQVEVVQVPVSLGQGQASSVVNSNRQVPRILVLFTCVTRGFQNRP